MLSIALFLVGDYNHALGGYMIGELNPNVFSSYLLTSLLGCLFLNNTLKNRLSRTILLSVITIGFVAQIQAGSRRGILIYILVIIMYLFSSSIIRYKKSSITKILAAFGVVAIILIILLDFSLLMPEYSNITQIFNSTVGDSRRAMYMTIALQIFRTHPIIGSGFGSVSLVAGMYSHSLYFELLATTGLIGLFVLLLPLVRIMYISYKECKRKDLDPEYRMQKITLVITILSILITGIAVVFIYDAIFYVFLAFLISENRIQLGQKS
jgi:O-Antigen ligase.